MTGINKFFLIVLMQTCLISFGQTKTQNIITYCKVWGVCKYYSHTAVNWDNIFFKDYERLLNTTDNKEFNKIIYNLIQQTKTTLHTATTDTFVNVAKLKTAYYNNKRPYRVIADFNWIPSSNNLSTKNKQYLVALITQHKKSKIKTIKKKGLLIYHKKELTYKEADNTTFLLALFRIYNVIEYYYPYKHLMDTPWQETLEEMMPKFIACNNKEDYERNIKLLASRIQDSHVWIDFGKKQKTRNTKTKEKYPIDIDFAEGKCFISNILNDSIARLYHIKKGNIITKVNGVSISHLLDSVALYNSCSNQQAIYEQAVLFILSQKHLTLTFEKDTSTTAISKIPFTFSAYVDFIYANDTYITNNDAKEISNNIGYIYMPATRYFSIKKLFKQFRNKETLILDCRGYGTIAALKIPKLLSKTPKDVSLPFFPRTKIPGILVKSKNPETYYFSNTIDLIGKFLFRYTKKIFPTTCKPYQGKIIVLINEDAISFGETVIMMIKAYAENVTLIGRPTAGANGDVVFIQLPFGEKLYYSSIDFRFPNGEELQRQGIQPDIFIPKTISNIINRKDAILNAAIQYNN